MDLNDYGLGAVPAERRNEVKKDVGEYLLSQIKKSARNITSPVSGESWKSTLSKDYRQEKMARGGGSSANLRLTGSLMNSLTYKLGPGGQVLVGNKSGGRNDRNQSAITISSPGPSRHAVDFCLMQVKNLNKISKAV